MSEKILKLSTILLKRAIQLTGIVLCVIIFMGEKTDPETGTELHAMGAIGTSISMVTWIISACFIFWVIFAVYKVISRPKKSINSLIGIAVMAIIAIISWSIATDEVLLSWVKSGNPDFTPANSKFSDFGLNMLYITFGLLVLTIIYAEVSKLFK
jgi:chromate transport protein ChrA